MATSQRYHPVPSSAPPFAHEFVKRMRNTQEVRAKPSVRQTQAIPQFLSARFFRNGDLSLDDFVEAAVYTSYPPDQDIARLIAEEILLAVVLVVARQADPLTGANHQLGVRPAVDHDHVAQAAVVRQVGAGQPVRIDGAAVGR